MEQILIEAALALYGVAGLIVIRLNRKMTATRRSGGGGAATEQRPISNHVRTHDRNASR